MRIFNFNVRLLYTISRTDEEQKLLKKKTESGTS